MVLDNMSSETMVKNFSITLLGLFVAIAFYASIVIFNLDLFERLLKLLMKFEYFEIDEVIVAFFVFLIFALCDHVRRRKARQMDAEKLKIYCAMMRSTNHVLNNFLNQMQLFKMTADKTPDFPVATLDLYDQIILEAQQQINALGSIEKIEEGEIWDSVTPKV